MCDVLGQRPPRQRQADAGTRRLVGENRVRNRERGERLDHGNGPSDDARIMTPLHRERRGPHRLQVDGRLLLEDGRGGSQRHAELDRHAAGASAENAALAIRRGLHHAILGDKGVVELRSLHQRAGETGAELDALHAGDGEHRRGEFGLQSLVERAAQSGGDAGHGADDRAADRIALLTGLFDLGDLRGFVRLAADRLDAGGHRNAARLQQLEAESADRAERRGEATGVLAAPRGDAPHLDPLAKVGMTWTRDRPFGTVVPRTHIDARDFATKHRPGRDTAGKSFGEGHAVWLPALRRQPVASGRATFHERRQFGLIKTNARGKVRERKRHPAGVGGTADRQLQMVAEGVTIRHSHPPAGGPAVPAVSRRFPRRSGDALQRDRLRRLRRAGT